MLELKEPLIAPIYPQGEPNAPIDLCITPVEFTLAGTTYHEDVHVRMSFLPKDRVLLVIPGDTASPSLAGVAPRLIAEDRITLSLPNYGQSFDALCTGVGSSHGGIVFSPELSVVTVTPPSTVIQSAVFHLFNFPGFIGADDYAITWGEPPLPGWTRCGRVILRSHGWTISIAATDKTRDLCEALRRQGGFVITHVGKIERADGSTFSSEQLADLLFRLHSFLSFALGRWAGVALPVGLNRSGERVFEQWGAPQVSANRWNGFSSWFDEHHGELLSEVFPGFLTLCNDPLWEDALKATTYWYVAANGRGTVIEVDTGILLAQIALERLAWARCVLDRRIAKKQAFQRGGYSAAEKLRLLLQDLSLSSAMPDGLSTLHSFNDGPEAITEIRNSLVHPDKSRSFSADSNTEAWKLSLWYLDLVLLRLCGHTGDYANRLARRWVGQVQPLLQTIQPPS